MTSFSLKCLFAYCFLVIIITSCSQKNNLCELTEADQALKTALKLRMTKWQKNAEYQNWENFERDVNQVIDELVIAENKLQRWEDEDCYCKTKIQFSDHIDFQRLIEEPVAKIKATEHQMNSPYLAIEEQISYLENDGFNFFYILKQNPDSSLLASQFYPLVLQPKIDEASKMIWDYLEYQYEK